MSGATTKKAPAAEVLAIDMRMSWAVCVPVIAAAIDRGTPTGKELGREQLRKMAQAADLAAELKVAAEKLIASLDDVGRTMHGVKFLTTGNAKAWALELADNAKDLRAVLAKVAS